MHTTEILYSSEKWNTLIELRLVDSTWLQLISKTTFLHAGISIELNSISIDEFINQLKTATNLISFIRVSGRQPLILQYCPDTKWGLIIPRESFTCFNINVNEFITLNSLISKLPIPITIFRDTVTIRDYTTKHPIMLIAYSATALNTNSSIVTR